MQALRDIESDGYPTDYLVARVRARRARLLADRSSQPGPAGEPESDAALWDALLDELDWLRRQMNPPVRAVFAPIFTLFVLKTLVLAVRNMSAERHEAAARLLQHELFSPDLREGLLAASDAAAAVAVVDAVSLRGGESHRLAAAYADGGLRAFESQLTRGFLAGVAAAGMHSVVRRFFVAFIDLRNVMTLYKQLHWGFQDAQAFVPGGSIPVEQLLAASSRGDPAGLDAHVAMLTGAATVAQAGNEVALETRLLSALTHRLREAARQGGDYALVLDYLWGVYVHARNRSLRLHLRDAEAVALERELIA